jgi:hypothetical protein
MQRIISTIGLLNALFADDDWKAFELAGSDIELPVKNALH